MNNSLRTDLAKARGTGSAKSGAKMWLHQRITAIILAMCSIWLIFFIKCATSTNELHFISILQKPYNIVLLWILLVTSFYHGMLGMQIVIEDYIRCIPIRTGLIILLKIFCIFTIAFLIGALFYITKL